MSQRFPRYRLVLAIGSTLAVLLALGGFWLMHSRASASGPTLYVGATVGSNTGCGSPGYTTVQSAVNAALNGQTVYLCGTTPYKEAVVIANKRLTLTGDPGATIASPTTFPTFTAAQLPPQFTSDHLFVPSALLFVWGEKANVHVKGLKIAGPITTNGGCANDEYGVLVLANATVNLEHVKVLDIRDSNPALYGCQYGVGIQIGREYWPTSNFASFPMENFAGNATITESYVAGYQKNGMTLDGPDSGATVYDNEVHGAGRSATISNQIAQNGIQISRGVYAKVYRNYIAGNAYTGPAYASSAGIIAFGGCGDAYETGITIHDNYLYNNDVGIYANNYSADPNCVAPIANPSNIKILENDIFNDKVSNVGSGVINGQTYNGYQAGIDDIGNGDTIAYNYIAGVGYHHHTTPGGPFVLPIDTVSFPTLNVHVHDNTIVP